MTRCVVNRPEQSAAELRIEAATNRHTERLSGEGFTPIIQAVERALKIMDLFDERETELKITDISERMGLHKSTVHSLLKTLQVHGYIEQNPENGKYRLGLKLVERGNLVVESLDIRSVAKAVLADLSARTGQTTHLVVLDGKEGVYIDKAEGQFAVICYSRIGKRIPLHSSAVGKVLAAFLPESRLDGLLKGYAYVAHTPNTIRDEAAFRRELEKVRRQGYAVDNQENEPGVRCVATPVRDHTGQVAAAISISTLVTRVGDEELETLIPQLLEAGREISRKLGYGG